MPVTIEHGNVKIKLSVEDFLSFQDWQRLSKEEKDSLIWFAENHPYLMQMVNAWRWLVQAGAGIVKLGAVAAGILGIVALVTYVADLISRAD